jgi:hypothetical protein
MESDAISKKYLTAEAAELISAIMRHKGIFFSFSFSGVASLLFVFLSALCDLRGELFCFRFDPTGSFLASGWTDLQNSKRYFNNCFTIWKRRQPVKMPPFQNDSIFLTLGPKLLILKYDNRYKKRRIQWPLKRRKNMSQD